MTSIKSYYAAWLEDSDEYYVHSFFLGKEQLDRLFLEHYLMLSGYKKQMSLLLMV